MNKTFNKIYPVLGQVMYILLLLRIILNKTYLAWSWLINLLPKQSIYPKILNETHLALGRMICLLLKTILNKTYPA